MAARSTTILPFMPGSTPARRRSRISRTARYAIIAKASPKPCTFLARRIANADGARVSVEALGLRHLAEDMSLVPSAADWLNHIELPAALAPASLRSPEELAAASARRFDAAPELLLPLHRWFLETSTWFPDARHLAMRHHSFGIFEAEARFGVLLGKGRQHPLPTRILGEWHVRAVLGRVPAATDFLRHLKGQRWMAAAQSSRRLGLC